MAEILPCPWCETNAALEMRDNSVNCLNCGCLGPMAHSPEGGRRAWNERTATAPTSKETQR
jgi:hypothetical protein